MTTIEFPLQGEYIALYQLLKLTGLCPSGGSAKLVIADGLIQIDGQTETRKACKIRSGQNVQLDDTMIHVVPS